MATTEKSGMAEIRGIDIDKLAKGFADEESVLRGFLTVTPTSARHIRWYQKNAGFMDSTDTSGVSLSQIGFQDQLSLPVVVEQKWGREDSYVMKYFVESPTLSDEDIRDTDIDILAANVRDLVRAVTNQVDRRIYGVLTEADAATPMTPNPSTTNYANAVADGWNDAVTGDPITDIMVGKENIRSYSYNPEGCILYMNQAEHRHLLTYLINVKGSSIPQFASQKITTGVVMEILGCRVVVSANATTDYVIMFVPQRAATWKTFVGLTTAVIKDPGIGTKIRVWEEGECILTDPRAVHVITATIVG